MSMVINNPSTGTGSSSSSTNPSSPSSSFSSSAFRPALPVADFLDHCFLCQTKLSPGKDIYMYRGDRAFCSEECRCRQILLDEEAFMRENKNQSHCSSAAHPSSSRNKGAPETEHLVACDINFHFSQQKQTGNDDEGKKMGRW